MKATAPDLFRGNEKGEHEQKPEDGSAGNAPVRQTWKREKSETPHAGPTRLPTLPVSRAEHQPNLPRLT
jgi:hypothetical protein